SSRLPTSGFATAIPGHAPPLTQRPPSLAHGRAHSAPTGRPFVAERELSPGRAICNRPIIRPFLIPRGGLPVRGVRSAGTGMSHPTCGRRPMGSSSPPIRARVAPGRRRAPGRAPLRKVIGPLAGLAGAAAALPAGYLAALSLAALRRPPRGDGGGAPGQRLVVLVPAHDEAELIGRCLGSLQDQTYPRDLYRIVVIADNCTDGTADLAAAAGAEV